ncbi:MAG: DUF429 domain-containing protein [Bdellovibrionales bacterium]|nr:DUF429 domain-containing protein [Bdellovibrionales bacterium]
MAKVSKRKAPIKRATKKSSTTAKKSKKKTSRKASTGQASKAKSAKKKSTKKTTKKASGARPSAARKKGLQYGSAGQALAIKAASLKVHHFLGVALGGGKTDKTCVALVDYYPDQNKIFLSRLFERVSTVGEVSSDLQLHKIVTELPGRVESVAFDVPLQLPKCLRCRLKCPGFEACEEPEIKWLWKHYRKRNTKKKPKKLFTPYTERCVEFYMQTELEEVFHPPHALGANVAPLTARAHFITRRLKSPCIEVYPKLSLWRIGRALGISKNHLRFHRHSFGGEESRKIILEKLISEDIAFLYVQDVKNMTANVHAFEAFISALTAVLELKKQCEPRPKGFPADESWISIPKVDVKWSR